MFDDQALIDTFSGEGRKQEYINHLKAEIERAKSGLSGRNVDDIKRQLEGAMNAAPIVDVTAALEMIRDREYVTSLKGPDVPMSVHCMLMYRQYDLLKEIIRFIPNNICQGTLIIEAIGTYEPKYCKLILEHFRGNSAFEKEYLTNGCPVQGTYADEIILSACSFSLRATHVHYFPAAFEKYASGEMSVTHFEEIRKRAYDTDAKSCEKWMRYRLYGKKILEMVLDVSGWGGNPPVEIYLVREDVMSKPIIEYLKNKLTNYNDGCKHYSNSFIRSNVPTLFNLMSPKIMNDAIISSSCYNCKCTHCICDMNPNWA